MTRNAIDRAPPPAMTPPKTDSELMEAIVRRDEGALEELYQRYSGLIYALCLKLLRRPADAQGVTSDVFWELWSRADRFNPNRGEPRTYLVMLARSRAIDFARGMASRAQHEAAAQELRTADVEPRQQASEPAQQMELREQRGRVRLALSRLPASQRQALELAFFEGLTQQQIAARLGAPLGTVKTNIRQGMIRLRNALAAEAGEEREA